MIRLSIVLIIFLLFFNVLASAQHEHAPTPLPADTLKKSIPKEVHAQFGQAHHMLHYYAPAVRGRAIWGGLVPYDEVWVTGAHRATTWEFDKAMQINGKTIPAGKYAFFTIPGKKQWTLIINAKWDQHLADEYSQQEDVLRIEVKPQIVKKHQERLTYYLIPAKQNKASLVMRWEKMAITVPFVVME